MLFSNNALRRITAVSCALLILLSVGCGKDKKDNKKGITETSGTSVVSSEITDTSSIETDKHDTAVSSDSETVTTELVSTPVALEPDDLDVNIFDTLHPSYQTILIDYRAMVQAVVNDDMTDNGDGTFTSPHYPYPLMSYSMTEIHSKVKDLSVDSFGYAVRDINNDGVTELLLICDNYAIIEIYTLINNEAKLSMFFWPGFTGTISSDGKLYSEMLASSTNMTYYAIETLDAEKGIFTAVKRLGRFLADDPSNVFYVEAKGDDEIDITKGQYEAFIALFPKIPKFGEPSDGTSGILEFIPISVDK
ncbi:MAG: hypothetical protein E7578_02445 [Ruminococcaceae bacterium]|nr:hypothetical protein [Oscillospiraceae bacterium]